MKKASEVLGLNVLGIKEGKENGAAQDFMLDPQTGKVEYLILKSSRGYGFNAIKITDIKGIGANYIMTTSVENAKKIYESKEILEVVERGFFMLGTTVLASSGDVLGTVEDFSFDEQTGEIGSLYLDNGTEFEGSKIASMAGEMVFVDPQGAGVLDAAPAAAPAAEAKKPEPAPPAKPKEQPKEQPKKSEPKTDSFEDESFSYLMGKTVKETVTSADGSFRVESGTVLTKELLKSAAKYDDVLLALTLNV